MRKRAKGTVEVKERVRQIAIRFEDEVFERISDAAQKSNRSFAEQVRVYVGLGMDVCSKRKGGAANG